MADNGQIDNVYVNFEVGGNAEEKLDEIDKALESIEDGANNAEKAFESFANVSKIDVLNKKLENVSENLNKAASKNKGLENKGVLNDLTKRFSLIDKLAKETAKTKPISEADYQAAENAIKKVSTEVGRLEEVLRVSEHRLAELKSQGKENTTQFVNLASKIAKTREKLEELRLAAKQDTLKALEWQIPDMSLTDEQRGNLERVIAAAEGGSNTFDKMGESIEEANRNLSSFSVDRLLTDEGKLDKLQGELVETTAKLRDLLNSGDEYSSKDVDSLVNQIHRLEREIDKTKKKLQEPMVDLMDYATKPMSRWQRILNSISSVFSKIGSIGSNAFKKIDKSTKKANNSSKNYNKGLRGLLGTAKRFLVFGTFFTIQRQISQAFSEGTQNLYQYSKAIDGKFAQSMDRLATSFLYLKNAIGAAVAPIINAVTPALESLIDTVAEFGNKLAETFAALTGATTFKKAIKSHKEYAEAVNNTNNALAKFDEINNITTSKSKEKQDFGSMFVETQVSTPDWANDIAKGIKNRDWSSVGSILSKKLNEQIKKLDEIDIGEKIGEKINGALDFANGFIGSFDFGNFARTLTTQITNFIKTINWGRIGELFSSSIIGAFDFLSEIARWFGSKETRQSVFNAIIKFIDNIDWVGVGKSVATFILDTIVAAIKWALDIRNWAKLIGTVIKAAGKLLFGIFDAVLTKVGLGGVAQKLGKSFGLYANGGYPASGEVFIARENGIPEMVGSIGGRTAVANNDQIVEAISIGVYNAYMDAMSRSGGNKQPTIVQINGKEVFRAVQDESTAYSRRTGQPAF